MNTYFTKQDIQRANKYMTRCSVSLAIRDASEIIMRYDYIPIRVAKIKSSHNIKY